MFAIPPAARLACWLNAWLAHRESSDDVIGGLSGPGTGAVFVLESYDLAVSPALLLGELRRRGVSRVTAALPTPGDPVGLGGPPAFNADALEAGQAVVLHGAGIGLVADGIGSLVTWRGDDAEPPVYIPDIGTADRELRAELLAGSERLAELDVASWSPDVADALLNLRAPAQLDAPMAFASPQAARTTINGLRAAEIVRLALAEEGGAITATEMAERRTALTPLLRSAHHAVVAGCSSLDGR